MPRLLYRYMITDLLRVGLLTTLILVTVIAFGATIKPLASDTLLTAGQTVKYMLLATVPMLQFALPFAAGFAGTMSLHRMAADNEIIAAAASGLSYRRLLMPVFVLGLLLMLVMAGLTQEVIPRFWGVLERAVRKDVTAVFQASLERGDPFSVGDLQIYADRPIIDNDPANTDADTRMVLVRVAVARLDDDGRVDEDVTANKAVIDIYRRPGATYLKMVLTDVVGYQPDSGTLASTTQIGPITRVIPDVLRDDPRRMTRTQLLALRANPDAYAGVMERKQRLARDLANVFLYAQIDERLRERGEIELVTNGSLGRRYIVRADDLSGARFRTDDGRPVEVIQFEQRGARFRMLAETARLHRHGSLSESMFDLELQDLQVTDLDDPATPVARKRVPLMNVSFVNVEPVDPSELSSEELLRMAAGLEGRDAGRVANTAQGLQRRIDELQREITARLIKRYALSVTATLLLLLGATMAMWLRDSMPLTIYLLAFLPSVLNLILISSGDHVIRDNSTIGGLGVMWSGNIVLTVLIVVAYVRLARN
jgi:lipopolysaccharide export LptBFGC system permease protein LptF